MPYHVMAYYILYNSAVGVYECEVADNYIMVNLGGYQLVYFVDTDRLVIRLGGLGGFLNIYDVPDYLDIDAIPSTYFLDALENMLKESIVLKEVIK